MGWNFDLSQAPKGYVETVYRKNKDGTETGIEVYRHQRIIAASKCGIVTISKWLPVTERGEGGRWECFTKESPPIAWHEWPTHPHAGE